jgi:uncharacterized membrane protein
VQHEGGSGTLAEVMVSTFPTRVDERAPVVGASEIEIEAPAETVWEVLTAFENWPGWNREVSALRLPAVRLRV